MSLIIYVYTLLISEGTRKGRLFRLNYSLKLVSSDEYSLSCCSFIEISWSPETQAIIAMNKKVVLPVADFFTTVEPSKIRAGSMLSNTDGLQLLLVTSQQRLNVLSYLAQLKW